MSLTPVKLGDRSRRGDDRYLFLEAIISARKALYLSFQGRNIKNNNERQPSIVLKELMDYLAQGYGYDFSEDNTEQVIEDRTCDDNCEENCEENSHGTFHGINQLPMQAFSVDNYTSKWPSFDARWLALALSSEKLKSEKLKSESINQAGDKASVKITEESITNVPAESLENTTNSTPNSAVSISADNLIRFYQHPARMFAQQNLNLYFDNDMVMLDDVEPFEFDRLQSYLVRQALLSACLSEPLPEGCVSENFSEQSVESDEVLQRAQLTGNFPDLPTTPDLLKDYVKDSAIFSDEIISQGVDNPNVVDVKLQLCIVGEAVADSTVTEIPIELNAQLPIKNQKLVHYRSSTAKAKDLFTQYINQLILQVCQTEQSNDIVQGVTENIGIYFNTKTQSVEQYQVVPIIEPLQKLQQLVALFIEGQQKPLLLNGDFAAAVFTKKRGKVEDFSQEKMQQLWQGDMSKRGFGTDAYINYFWPTCPDYTHHESAIHAVYADLYQVVDKVKAAKPVAKKKSVKGATS
jgi:exodeoxyribonuclease V gamma subunit